METNTGPDDTQSSDTDKGTTPKNMKKRFSFSFKRNRSRKPSGEEKSEASKIDEEDGKYETLVDDILGDVADQLATNEDNNDEDSTCFVSTENLDKDTVDEVKYKSVEKVLQFPVVRDMYDWATSFSPYLHPAVEKMGPVLDMGLVKSGYKETIQQQTEKVDGAAWKFLEMLEEKYPFLMKPTEHVWRDIKVRIRHLNPVLILSLQVIPAGYFEPVLEFLGRLSLSAQFETYREDIPSFINRI